ncbi:MAG TPA: OB-fold domain-containing protein [Acidimicrobiales bacterium]|jgi:hypothetical protein
MTKPLPIPDRLTQPYWEAARRRELRIQRCKACGRFQHPPGPVCRQCYGDQLEFDLVQGRGRIYSYTVTYHNFVPGFEENVPLPIVLVELDEHDGVRLMANLVARDGEDHVELGAIAVGAPVEVAFQEVADGITLPQFRLVEEGKDA